MPSQWTITASHRGIAAIQLKAAIPSRMKLRDKRARSRQIAAQRELDAYFAGRLTHFTSHCDIADLPPFTRAVLDLTAKIPYGEVRSYQWIARRLGKPKAARAVGNALARNPIPIIIPCHRVVRSDGVIGGFALGTAWKKRLLALEQQFANAKTPPHRRG